MKKIFLVLVAVSIVFMFAGSVSADLSLGLVAYYPFNGNAKDESGNGNHGIVNGATLTYDRFGNPDNAYSFNGVSGDINIGGNVKPPFPVSVSVWVNANDLDANGCGFAGIVRNDQYDSGSYRYGLAVWVTDGYLSARYYEGFSTYSNRIGYISNDALISVGNWYHLVVVFNAHKNIQLFVNGVEYPGSYDNGTGSGMSYSGGGDGAIGTFKVNRPVRSCTFNGIVDELRFYNRALSETEILELYEEETHYYEGIYDYYLPYYSSLNNNWTGLGLVNRSQIDSTDLQVTVYGSGGNLLATENKTIPARGQDSFIVATQLNNSGWMQVNSHQPLSGLAFLGSWGIPLLMADIPFISELSSCLVIPHIAQDGSWDTTILICNPNNETVSVALKYFDKAGVEQGAQNYTILAYGSGEYSLSTVFSDKIPLAGSVEINSSSGVVVFALYSDKKNGGTYYAGINAESCD